MSVIPLIQEADNTKYLVLLTAFDLDLDLQILIWFCFNNQQTPGLLAPAPMESKTEGSANTLALL